MRYLPVMIDKLIQFKPMEGKDPDGELVRGTFFVVETTEPDGAWEIRHLSRKVPVFLLSMQGVIWKPRGRNKVFRKPEEIQELFDWIEKDLSLLVEIDEVHFPRNLFGKESPRRGQVYRVRADLFRDAYLWTVGRLTGEKSWQRGKENVRKRIRLSAGETAVFARWQGELIKAAKEQYYDSKKGFTINRNGLKRKEGGMKWDI